MTAFIIRMIFFLPRKVNYLVGVLFFSAYTVILLVILSNLMITIICRHFTKTRIANAANREESELEYLVAKVKTKLRPKQGVKIDAILGKSDKRRSMNCEAFDKSTERLITFMMLMNQNDEK